ncbi:MAG: aspartate aminotransferase family protein [Gammaproteobacteria bacterium]
MLLLGAYSSFPLTLVSGEADRVFDREGRAYWDFYGAHCVATTGHAHPEVVAAIHRQAQALLFYSTAARLRIRDTAAGALLGAAPAGMGGVFFCNSGAEANENALKTAFCLSGRGKIVAFDGAFHGRTLLALAATDNQSLHAPFEAFMPEVMRLPFGNRESIEAADLSDAAAVIVEPVQSMAGVRSASPQWLASVVDKARAAGAFTIFDEVQTGMGRLGAMFAAELFGVTPDFITCAKGMASGVPMGAMMVAADIAPRIPPGTLGSTFGGSPLACAALLATLEVIEREQLCANACAAGETLRTALAGSVVKEVRGRGLLLGLDVGAHARSLKAHLFRRGILVGGSADPSVLRLMPPLNLSREAMAALIKAVHSFNAYGEAAEAVEVDREAA